MGSDPEGPLCELLFFFLTAIFQALDEEQEEVATDQVEGQTHLLSLLAVHYRKLTNTRKTLHKLSHYLNLIIFSMSCVQVPV